MRYYFCIDPEGHQVGPLNFEELKGKGFVAATPVWYEGLADWTTAGEVAELKAWLQAGSVQNTDCPPPYPTSVPQGDSPACGRNMPENRVGQYEYGTQSHPFDAQSPQIKPDTWLVGAILSTILCCLPLGIAAIIMSTTGSAQWDRGETSQAIKSFHTAKILTIISIVSGILCLVVYAVLVVISNGF